MLKPHHHHPLWLAYMLHRLSGLALALFLPVHFHVLSMAITRPESFDHFLSLAANPMVKLMEFGLVFLLAVHFFGGLRLLVLEFLPWSPGQKSLAAASVAGAFLISGTFLLRAV